MHSERFRHRVAPWLLPVYGSAPIIEVVEASAESPAETRDSTTVPRRRNDDTEGHQESDDTGPTGSTMAFVLGATGAGEPQSSIASTLTVSVGSFEPFVLHYPGR
jgi:hypothetical protein